MMYEKQRAGEHMRARDDAPVHGDTDAYGQRYRTTRDASQNTIDNNA